MDIESMFDHMPYNREFGIEITEAVDGHAAGRIDLADRHSSSPDTMVAHGGVAYSLADTVGGAAAMSEAQSVTPTIDMRIDYLAPGTGEAMLATGDVVRFGESVATVDVTVTDGDGRTLATARGTYKTGGDPAGSAWSDETGQTRVDRVEE